MMQLIRFELVWRVLITVILWGSSLVGFVRLRSGSVVSNEVTACCNRYVWVRTLLSEDMSVCV